MTRMIFVSFKKNLWKKQKIVYFCSPKKTKDKYLK